MDKKIIIRQFNENDDDNFKTEFHELLEEYFPETDEKKCRRMMKNYGQCFLLCYLDERIEVPGRAAARARGNKWREKLVGICYGWPEKSDANKHFMLQGIAVREEYSRQEIGGVLLAKYEEAVQDYGYSISDVGSVTGYPERFYVKNGYSPVSYEYLREDGELVEEKVTNREKYLKLDRLRKGRLLFEKNLETAI